MNRQSTIGHLVAALAWLGLVLAPSAVRTAAAAVTMEVAAVHVDAPAMDMSEDTPCCPDAQKAPDCAKDCPFMGACVGGAFPPLVYGTFIEAPMTVLAVILPGTAAKLTGLAQAPPAKPPKA
jgi:hypothetical protein